MPSSITAITGNPAQDAREGHPTPRRTLGGGRFARPKAGPQRQNLQNAGKVARAVRAT